MRARAFIALLLCGCAFAQTDRIRQLAKTDSQAIPELAGYLQNSDRDSRYEAVKAIVRIGGPASLDPLITATRDNDGDVCTLATDGLVNFYLPGYVPKGRLTGPITRGVRQVKGLVSSRNDEVIPADMSIRPSVADAIAQEVAHGPGMDVRANAARAAGILRDHAAVPALEEALRSKDDGLIIESLIALQKIGDPSAGPSVSFLARDLDDRVQITALETIGDLKSLDSAPQVRRALADARNAKVRRAALSALAMLGIAGDRATFQRYASDKDEQIRAAAIEGLGRTREPEDTPVMQAAYNEPNVDWRVHLAAAYGLVSEGQVDTAEYSPLRFLVENLDLKNRGSVSEAYLTELARRAEVRSALAKLAPDATADQKIALCTILGSTRQADVLPTLATLAKDPDSQVALAAVKAQRVAQAGSR